MDFLIFDIVGMDIGAFGSGFIFDIGLELDTLWIVFLGAIFGYFSVGVGIQVLSLD